VVIEVRRRCWGKLSVVISAAGPPWSLTPHGHLSSGTGGGGVSLRRSMHRSGRVSCKGWNGERVRQLPGRRPRRLLDVRFTWRAPGWEESGRRGIRGVDWSGAGVSPRRAPNPEAVAEVYPPPA
jgi:hypothetical protein